VLSVDSNHFEVTRTRYLVRARGNFLLGNLARTLSSLKLVVSFLNILSTSSASQLERLCWCYTCGTVPRNAVISFDFLIRIDAASSSSYDRFRTRRHRSRCLRAAPRVVRRQFLAQVVMATWFLVFPGWLFCLQILHLPRPSRSIAFRPVNLGGKLHAPIAVETDWRAPDSWRAGRPAASDVYTAALGSAAGT
jgi:hypothetical protein